MFPTQLTVYKSAIQSANPWQEDKEHTLEFKSMPYLHSAAAATTTKNNTLPFPATPQKNKKQNSHLKYTVWVVKLFIYILARAPHLTVDLQ